MGCAGGDGVRGRRARHGGRAYRVAVRVSDGRRLLYLDRRARSLTVPRIARGMRVPVQVRAAALPGGKIRRPAGRPR
jgi:hypothetical protein